MLRHNLTQELLADIHMVFQSTISRVVTVYAPLIAEVLQAWVPETGASTRIGSTSSTAPLVPCWSWHEHPELCSGKHRTTGVNLQVVCTLAGCLAWISEPFSGQCS